MIFATSLVFLAVAAGVNAHGELATINGANGAKANGLAILPGTPGTVRSHLTSLFSLCPLLAPSYLPNQGSTKVTKVDTTIFGAAANRDPSAATGCGKTPGGGTVDCATAAAASLATSGGTVPTADSDGNIALTFHQVNQDGAGPLSAMVSGDMGQTWQAATVQQNAPGFFGLSGTANEDIPVNVQVPAGTTCSGTAGSATGVCLVALANPIEGFGGSAPFQMGSAAPAAASGSSAAVSSAPAAADAAPAASSSPAAAGGAVSGLSSLLGSFGKRDLPVGFQIEAIRVKRTSMVRRTRPQRIQEFEE